MNPNDESVLAASIVEEVGNQPMSGAGGPMMNMNEWVDPIPEPDPAEVPPAPSFHPLIEEWNALDGQNGELMQLVSNYPVDTNFFPKSEESIVHSHTGQSLTRIAPDLFRQEISRTADVQRCSKLRLKFRDPLSPYDYLSEAGSCFHRLYFQGYNNENFNVYDRTLLFNLSPEIQRIDPHVLEITFPTDSMNPRDLRSICHQYGLSGVLETRIGTNEIEEVGLLMEKVYLDTQPRQQMAVSNPVETVVDFDQVEVPLQEEMMVPLVDFRPCRGLLITSTHPLPKCLDFQIQLNGHLSRRYRGPTLCHSIWEQIGPNLYYYPFNSAHTWEDQRFDGMINFPRIDHAQLRFSFAKQDLVFPDQQLLIYGVTQARYMLSGGGQIQYQNYQHCMRTHGEYITTGFSKQEFSLPPPKAPTTQISNLKELLDRVDTTELMTELAGRLTIEL